MRYMMIVHGPQDFSKLGPPPMELMEATGKLAEDAMKSGNMISMGGLRPTSQGAQIAMKKGKLVTTDGPFTEAKEVIGGFMIMELASKEEALAEATKFMELHVKLWPQWEGTTEVRAMYGDGEMRRISAEETDFVVMVTHGGQPDALVRGHTLREAVMFTVTMGRSLSVLSIAAAVAVAAKTASAQVIITGDGAARGAITTMMRRAITISDDSVRAYLSRFEAGVLDDDSGDANIVTMVLDNDGAYVRSSTRHAKIMQAVPGRVMVINGDSVRAVEGAGRIFSIGGDSARTIEGAGGRVISITGAGPGAVTFSTSGDAPAAGAVIAVNTLRRADGEGAPGMVGGVSPDEIGGIATKRYAAGEMGKGQIIVTFIYLK